MDSRGRCASSVARGLAIFRRIRSALSRAGNTIPCDDRRRGMGQSDIAHQSLRLRRLRDYRARWGESGVKSNGMAERLKPPAPGAPDEERYARIPAPRRESAGLGKALKLFAAVAI